MKTKLILGSLLALSVSMNSQNTFPSTGNVGVGTTSPAYPLDVQTTLGGGMGIRIKNNGTVNNGGEATLRLDATGTVTGGREYGIHSIGNGWGASGPAGSLMFRDETALLPRMIIMGGTGNVGIGTTSPADKLSIAGNVAPNIDGAYTCGTSSNRWSAVWATNGTIQTSDQRYKTNIKDLRYGLQDILKLRPVSYNWKEGDKALHIGLIAQELKAVINEAVYEGDDENKKLGVAYSDLIPVLINAIQQQQAQILSQQQQLDALTQKSSNATGINNTNTIETGFQMSQNEPNPFTHETIVKYTLPQTTSNAFMAVYDLSGKQMATFPITEKGASSLTITSEKLAAGIYIYSIVADGKVVDSKRMIVSEK